MHRVWRRYSALVERTSDGSAQLLTLSPCVLDVPTLWHVAVALEPHDVATARGLSQAEFVLTVQVWNSPTY